jgi:RNA polymerase sigma-70 factor, ECF subfamily
VPFDAWILRVARDSALDHLRARRQVPIVEVRAADAGHQNVSSERLESLRTALDRLPKDRREVLILRHIAGLTPGEIGTRSTARGARSTASTTVGASSPRPPFESSARRP